jgi:hypothetical protein
MAFHFSARSSAIGALLLAAGCMSGESTGGSPELAGGGGSGGGSGPGAAPLVSVTNLSSDQAGNAAGVDSSLVNAWGIVAYQGWFWVTDNATGKLSIFDGAGHMAGAQQGGGTGTGGTGTGSGSDQSGQGSGSGQSGQGSGSGQSGQGSGSGQSGQGSGSGQGTGILNVVSGSIDLGAGITGIAVNDSTAMQMDGTGANAQVCGPANLIVASEKGQLIGVNTSLNATGGQVLVDRSGVGAAYTGVAVLDVKAGATCSATGGTCDTPGMGSGSGSDNSQGSGSGSGSGSSQGSGNGNGSGYGSGSAGAGSGSAGAGSGSGSAGAGSGSGSGSAGAGNGNGNGGTGNAPQPGVLVLAADFHNARIDVFDEKFNLVTTPMFSTPASIPAGFAPFNVAVINGIVYVTFAQQNEAKDDSVAGAGLGFVAAFDVCGNMLWTAKGSQFNAPWGMALGGDLAPGALLVGNFGDGHITELNPKDGTVIGQLMTADNAPVVIDGLWGLAIGTGSGVAVQSAMQGGVYFAAGPGDEAHGVFGVIAPSAAAMPGPGSGSGSGSNM